jgi:hypothetical protein
LIISELSLVIQRHISHQGGCPGWRLGGAVDGDNIRDNSYICVTQRGHELGLFLSAGKNLTDFSLLPLHQFYLAQVIKRLQADCRNLHGERKCYFLLFHPMD